MTQLCEEEESVWQQGGGSSSCIIGHLGLLYIQINFLGGVDRPKDTFSGGGTVVAEPMLRTVCERIVLFKTRWGLKLSFAKVKMSIIFQTDKSQASGCLADIMPSWCYHWLDMR